MAKRAKKVITVSGQSRPVYSKLVRGSKTFEKDFKAAMYFVHYEMSEKDLKKATLTYAKSAELDHKALDQIPGHSMIVLGKACHIANNKGDLPENWQTYMDMKLAEFAEAGALLLADKKEEKKATAGPIITIQDRLRETVVFKRLPEIMSEEERQALLDKATMYLMAHDYARLVETIHRTQEALKSDDAQLAQTIMEFIFE